MMQVQMHHMTKSPDLYRSRSELEMSNISKMIHLRSKIIKILTLSQREYHFATQIWYFRYILALFTIVYVLTEMQW